MGLLERDPYALFCSESEYFELFKDAPAIEYSSLRGKYGMAGKGSAPLLQKFKKDVSIGKK
jgi:hypothetical protein